MIILVVPDLLGGRRLLCGISFMNISAERRSITIAGTYKPRRHEFVLKPIFVSSQMPTDISDRTDAIKRLASVKAYEAGRPDAVQQYMDIATQEFEAHTLTVVQRNESFAAMNRSIRVCNSVP